MLVSDFVIPQLMSLLALYPPAPPILFDLQNEIEQTKITLYGPDIIVNSLH